MELTTVWFWLIAFLWAGYFLLEGFDFGVGMLLRRIGRDPVDRSVVLAAIGPVWDGNEVWMIVAAGATFAAFPAWYASMFSGFYLPFLLVLVALILRAVALEWRGKVDGDRWRAWCDRAIFWGSALPALIWGVAFANLVRGLPMDARGTVHASPADLLSPYALLGGFTTLAVFLLHGAVFLTLKTEGLVRERARRAAFSSAAVAVPALTGFLAWTQHLHGKPGTAVTAAVAAVALAAGAAAAVRGREGVAFGATAVAIVLTVVTLFGALWPNVLPSTTDPAVSLTVTGAASGPYTLTVVTWLAAIATPIVLLYQGWTYWIFRRRLTRADVTP
ncbi:MAG: cytochrome bd ubiquinol oxidase subunit [Streptosporangiaceae bacterium]|jgi:cytochrome d ubiquinol oxidase subunit II|nr:cydB2 [Streptosporangiaceae bacterium]MDX6434875.1 cytochrome bd ubiquinol oxidase subunit [Streptosporangiaceae bacterium]